MKNPDLYAYHRMSLTKHASRLLHQLPSVCKRFKNVFVENPSLRSVLILKTMESSQELIALTEYITRHHGCVEVVVARCCQQLLSPLFALATLRSPVKTLWVAFCDFEVAADKIALSSQFGSLSTCMLDFDPRGRFLSDPGVSLLPFRNLHHLNHLQLHGGTFLYLNALMHLTFLSLRQSSADCSKDLQSAESLLELHL